MNTDLLFLLGMGLFYLLRKLSRQKQDKARQFQLDQIEQLELVDQADQVPSLELGSHPVSEPFAQPEPAKKQGSIMASITAMIEAEAARQREIENPTPPAKPVQKTSMTKTSMTQMPGDSFGGFNSSFKPGSGSFTDEWQTETREDWSDQTTDYDFHSAVEKGREPAPSTPVSKVDPFTDDGARHAPGLAELDRRTPSHKLSRLYQSKNSLAEAIILSEIIGKPVSRRTRSARRPLS
jgi:hypothetical protein